MRLSKKKVKKVKRDKLGSIIGSANSKINAVLSRKPKTMKELTSAAKVSGTHYEHLNNLAANRLVIKEKVWVYRLA